MNFVKMHGLGNDYVYIETFTQTVDDPASLAVKMADRHFGVGGDGLILVAPPDEQAKAQGAEVRMRMFNSDGSEAEMCGNGVRCVCKFAADRGLATSNPMKVQTGNGVLSLAYETDAAGKVSQVTVNMGQPILELPQVPVDPSKLTATDREHVYRFEALGQPFEGVFVSVGNPHVTIYVDNAAAVDLEKLGPAIEKHPAFPRRINAHFVQVHSEGELTMRTWERGSGITLACGTGASAVCVSGVLAGRGGRKVLAHLPGGDLTLEWRQSDGHVYMTGPATQVFEGRW